MINGLNPSHSAVDIYWEHNLSQWMGQKLGKKWSIGQSEESGQNILLRFDVHPLGQDSEIDPVAETEAWLTRFTPNYAVGRWEEEKISTDTLLAYLCGKGEIVAGTYYVEVWW